MKNSLKNKVKPKEVGHPVFMIIAYPQWKGNKRQKKSLFFHYLAPEQRKQGLKSSGKKHFSIYRGSLNSVDICLKHFCILFKTMLFRIYALISLSDQIIWHQKVNSTTYNETALFLYVWAIRGPPVYINHETKDETVIFFNYTDIFKWPFVVISLKLFQVFKN